MVPEHLKQEILDEHHDSPFAGHFAAKKMAQRISQYFFWNGLKADVYKKCASCIPCASVKGHGQKGKPPLVSIPVGGAFDYIGMDFVELDKTKDGKKYALVFQDYLSKWPEVYALPDHKAEIVARCLLDLVWRHGVPNRIIHDRAAEFLSDVLQETARLIGVRQLPTSGGHPQTDGLVERFNKTLKQMLSKVVNKGGQDAWASATSLQSNTSFVNWFISILLSLRQNTMFTNSTRLYESDPQIPCDGVRVWSSTREGAEGSEIASPEEPSSCTVEAEDSL